MQLELYNRRSSSKQPKTSVPKPACNGQTDEQTHYAHGIYRASKASRGKNHQWNIVARRECSLVR